MGMTASLNRETILASLQAVLEPLDYVYAMWEGGSTAFQRADAWSDIDLLIVAKDEHVGEVFPVIEDALRRLSPIDLKYEIPVNFLGNPQCYYRLKDASPFLLLDIEVIANSQPDKTLQPEIHGQPKVYFDKCGVVVLPAFDKAALAATLLQRMEYLRVTFDMFQVLVLKEYDRHNDIEALSFYLNYTLRPLVEALRIHYAPARYNFRTRYVQYDFPPDVMSRLNDLYYVASPGELPEKRRQAERLFWETLAQIDLSEI